MLRNFLNSILEFIGTTSLTDDEYDTVTSVVVEASQSTYDDLARVLVSRETVSTLKDQLKYYFYAKGVMVNAADTAKSNIWIGSGLD